jgi:hypothetical protein
MAQKVGKELGNREVLFETLCRRAVKNKAIG